MQNPSEPVGRDRYHVLIPSAGTGSRSGAEGPKQYQVVAGRRLIDHTVAACLAVPVVRQVVVVVAPGDVAYTPTDVRVQVAPVGGATRAQSVHNGLSALRLAGVPDSDWVLVHDAARCLLAPADLQRLIDTCTTDGVGGLLALPLPDTLKAGGAGRVLATVDRADKWLAQTPQMFRLGPLWAALESARPSGYAGVTDEASAMEAQGLQPLLVVGSARNIKVTYPDDFAVAAALLVQNRS
ncbi:MAG: 2C-methyl-D-erythritol 2,4-cyclodiphosphate synthase [Pseudomonadota bacterium]